MRRLALLLLLLGAPGPARAGMPEELAQRIGRPDVPATAKIEITSGRVAVWALERDGASPQVTVVGAVKLPVSPKQITRDLFVRDALLGSDALRAAGEFSEPAVAGDLALFSVPDSDIVALSECAPGDCRLRLGESQLAALRGIDWEAPEAQQQVDELVRGEVLELVQAYQAEGRAALERHVGRPDAGSLPGVSGMPLTGMSSRKLVDSVRAFLREYPASKDPDTRSRLHWNVRPYGYRPVTSIVHTVALEPGMGQPAALIAAETLYASHYFDARLQLLGLFSDTENPDQTWAIYSERLLFDDDLGTIQRRLLRRAVLGSIEERLARVVEEYRSR